MNPEVGNKCLRAQPLQCQKLGLSFTLTKPLPHLQTLEEEKEQDQVEKTSARNSFSCKIIYLFISCYLEDREIFHLLA